MMGDGGWEGEDREERGGRIFQLSAFGRQWQRSFQLLSLTMSMRRVQ
jgi:hypothetical protein